jgi:hypothetical protein
MRQTPAIWVEPSVDVVEGYVTAVDGFTHAIRSEPACVVAFSINPVGKV